MRLIEHFFRLLAPDECLNCGIEGALLCKQCSSTIMQRLPERCYRCYRLSTESKTCSTCRNHSSLAAVWIRTLYNPASRKVVHSLKFNFNRDAAKFIASEIITTLPLLPKGTIIMHVPAATTHIRRRGFDQSALIAREVSRLLNLPYVHGIARYGQQRQVGAARTTRMQQMKGAFRIVSPYMVKEANILLIDDVITTGSTLEAAALTLKNGGARSVTAACFAQAK